MDDQIDIDLFAEVAALIERAEAEHAICDKLKRQIRAHDRLAKGYYADAARLSALATKLPRFCE